MRKNKLLLLLALLMTAATGAWADETLLLTIESKDYTDFTSGSKTFDDKVTVNFSNPVYYNGEAGWYSDWDASQLTVAGTNGYTITSCKFYTKEGSANTGYTVQGESPSVYLSEEFVYTDASQSGVIGYPGINKIEVYGTAPAGYTVSLKDGVKDADKWTVSPNPAPEGSPVTIQYTGRLKVKGVTATSEAAEASVPDGAINGKFSVSDTKQVYFSKGNLQATYNTSWTWAFATNQWDYIGNAAGNTSINGGGTISGTGTVDLFGWVGAACAWTGAAQYGISNEKAAAQYGNVEGEALKSDWGTLAITNGGNTANFGWHSLASSEWEYLFKTRTTPSGVRYAHATVNSVPGLVLLPDDWSTDYYSLNNVNDAYDTAYTDNVISSSDWTSKLEAHGAVFLPAGGNRGGATVNDAGNRGNYWSSTPGTSSQSACYFYFGSGRFMGNTSNSTRNRGCSVRLVWEVATSDAPATGNSVDLSTLTADYVAQNGDVLTGETSSYEVTIADGATVTLDGVTINGSSYCIKCAGDATIILKDGSTNTLTNTGGDYPALSIGDANTTLTIQGSTGVLNVSSGMYCAGIGGGYSNTNSTCGNIRIEGGVITAKGGIGGAGIGSDYNPATCGDIIITGGTITAKGGSDAAGIGTGTSDVGNSVCGNITIANTVTKVTATAGENAPHSIGKGSGGKASCGTVTIGGTKYWENNAAVNGGDTYLAQSPLIYDPTAAAKPAATVTTAPTGAAIVGVGKTTALVSGGVADGGTLMYAVTTTNTKPTSTAGFSDAVPTAKDITASGKVYVWYYVKGDDTHSDSEIAATAIEVPVADIIWDATNVSDLEVWGDFSPYTKDGVKLSGNTENVQAVYHNYGDPETDGIVFEAFGSGGFTFTAPADKAFTKIEMKAKGIAGWDDPNLGTGWAYNNLTVTWKGTAAASTVELLKDADMFSGESISYIAFYLSE